VKKCKEEQSGKRGKIGKKSGKSEKYLKKCTKKASETLIHIN